MLDKLVRHPKERWLEPLARGPLRHLSPNTLTLGACALGLAASFAASMHNYGLALALWLSNRLLDGLDGTLARTQNKQSDFGAYLDILLDTIVYVAMPLGIAISFDTREAYLSLALLLCSFYINSVSWIYLSALLEKRRQGAKQLGEITAITMPSGLIEGTETVLFYMFFLLFPEWSNFAFTLMAHLVFFTAGQRVWWAARHL